MKASKIGESLRSYQQYPAKSVGKHGGEFLLAALVKSLEILFIGNLVNLMNLVPQERDGDS
jgi:hypothetical protein